MKKFLLGLAALTAMMTGLVLAADVGTKADTAAVRALDHQLYPNETADAVHVVGDYALLTWRTNPEGVGTHTFKRISGKRWKMILASGETETSTSHLTKAGVPASVARQLCSGWAKGSSPCMN